MSAAEAIEIRPNPGPQEMILSSPADVLIGGGGAGGGKSWSILAEPLRHIHVPGFSAVIFRRTTPEIRNPGGLWQESFAMYQPFGGVPREQYLDWRFPSGAVVKFAGMQNEQDRNDWAGAQVALLEFDQVEQFTEEQWWFMFSRNRSTSGVQPYIRATANPVPPDDATGGWLHKLIGWWIDPETGYAIDERNGILRWFVRLEGDTLDFADTREELVDRHGPESMPKSLTFVHARLSDNPVLERTDPGYRANLLALDKVNRERLLGGNWLIRPTAGLVFDRSWFGEPLEAAPLHCTWVRYWDKAATEGGGAMSAGVKMGYSRKLKIFVIADAVYGQWSASKREEVIRQCAIADGKSCTIITEQEPGSGGKESAQATIRGLAGWNVRADRVTGDKIERAQPMSAQAEVGNIKLVRGAWNADFLDQAQRFAPGRALKDIVDAAVGAFNYLAAHKGPDVDLPAGALAEATESRIPGWRVE